MLGVSQNLKKLSLRVCVFLVEVLRQWDERPEAFTRMQGLNGVRWQSGAATPLSHAREVSGQARTDARSKAAWRSCVASRRTPHGFGLSITVVSVGAIPVPVCDRPSVN